MNGLLAVAGQPLEDGSASRISEDFEEIVYRNWHGKNNNQMVIVCQ
jgi:hypothetical protein